MAQTPDIPILKEKWPDFLQMLASELLDHPIRVEVENGELGDQEMGDLLPMRDLEFEKKGSERGNIELTVGSERGDLRHRIEHPSRIYVRLNGAGEVECIAIEGQGGDKTLIYFEHLPALPAELTSFESQPGQ